MTDMTGGNDRFVARARAVFDEGVRGIDGNTLSRLTQARHAAVAQLGKPAIWRSAWMPAGALAAAAVLAVVLWMPASQGPATPALLAVTATDDFELLATSDDLDLLDEDIEFYAWAAQAESFNGIG